MVAGRARRDDVLPHRCAPARAWDDVVEREPVALGPAVDALPAVAGEQDTARDALRDAARHPDVRHEPDDVRSREGRRRRPQRLTVALEHLGLPLPHEHVRATDRAHVQRLVARIQDEDALHRARNVAPASRSPRRSGCMIRDNMHNTMHAERGDRRGVRVRRSGDARPRARAPGTRALRARSDSLAGQPAGDARSPARPERLEPHAAVHHERGGARVPAPTSRSSVSPTRRPRRSTSPSRGVIVDLSGAHRFVDAARVPRRGTASSTRSRPAWPRGRTGCPS